MEKRAVLKNYGLLGAMLAAMLTGGVTGPHNIPDIGFGLVPKNFNSYVVDNVASPAGCGLPPPGPSARWGKFSSTSCSAWWCRWCFPPSQEPSPECGASAGPGASWASRC